MGSATSVPMPGPKQMANTFLCRRIDDATVEGPLFFKACTGKVPTFDRERPRRKTVVFKVWHGNKWNRIDELLTVPWFSKAFGEYFVRSDPWLENEMVENPQPAKWIRDGTYCG